MAGCEKLCTVLFHGGRKNERCEAPIWKGTLCKDCYPGSKQELIEQNAELRGLLEEVLNVAPASGPLWFGSEQMTKARALITKLKRAQPDKE